MSQDKLKLYSVKVEGGSGCFFQPMTDKYTYILTAKHLFYEVNKKSPKFTIKYEEGRKLKIFKHLKTKNGWELEEIQLTLKTGVTYFPHKQADIAILRIEYMPNYNSIFVKKSTNQLDNYQLCGFPVSREDNEDGEKYGTQKVHGFGATGNYCQGAQLFNTLQQNDIEGFSGCGILKILNRSIYIIGIQSKMASRHLNQAGQVGFVPIKYFDDIFDEYSEQLERLYPDYMSNFSFLQADAFKLEVDAFNEHRISATRTTLKNKALKVINSDITPYGIKMLFNTRILIDDKFSEHLSVKSIWIAWLEFLTVMNVAKNYDINNDTLSDIFDTIRLKHSEKDIDWTYLFKEELLNTDFKGLKPNSIVVVSTKNPPIGNLKVKRASLKNHIGVVPREGLRIDNGINSPYDDFDFVHLEFFKKGCIADRLDQYDNINDENELLRILKQQYNELFS